MRRNILRQLHLRLPTSLLLKMGEPRSQNPRGRWRCFVAGEWRGQAPTKSPQLGLLQSLGDC